MPFSRCRFLRFRHHFVANRTRNINFLKTVSFLLTKILKFWSNTKGADFTKEIIILPSLMDYFTRNVNNIYIYVVSGIKKAFSLATTMGGYFFRLF